MRALVSVHDVAPDNLDAIDRVIDALGRLPASRVSLLVIPGRPWDEPALARLMAWQRAGYRLAGHGWHHNAPVYGGWYHRLHGLVLSRRVAEHLALDERAIVELMCRTHAWFAEHGLAPPDLYVPPAWALGRVSPPALRMTPFAYVEDTLRLWRVADGRCRHLALAGFEADRAWRAAALSLWNGLNRRMAGSAPIRLAIHPHDPQLRLGRQLRAWIAWIDEALDYRMLHATY